MLEFLIDNIFLIFRGRNIQLTVGISIGAKFIPLLAQLFLYSYEADFIQGLLKENENKLGRSFNFKFRYIYNVLSLNSYTLGDVVDRIYPIELEIKDITATAMSVSYLDQHIEIDSEAQLRITIYEKEIISSFPLRTLYLYVATFQQHMHMEHISLKLSQSM